MAQQNSARILNFSISKDWAAHFLIKILGNLFMHITI